MADDGWRKFDTIEATFRPQVVRTLGADALPFIGRRIRLYCAWPIELEDGGDYVGQHAWLLVDFPEKAGDDPGWFVTEDLADIVVLRRGPAYT